jgi:glycerate-2-kinase
VLGIILSDVMSGDLASVGSGPIHPDATTYADALAVLQTADPDGTQAPGARRHLEAGARGVRPETPKPGDPVFGRCHAVLVAEPSRLAAEAVRTLKSHGYETQTTLAQGPVSELAQEYGRMARELCASNKPRAVVAAGEPTLRVPQNAGSGGRSQHLALEVARHIDGLSGIAFLAAGSDGIDGTSTAAGAAIDASTWSASIAAGQDPGASLDAFESAGFHVHQSTAIVSGPTCTNLTDLHVLTYTPK